MKYQVIVADPPWQYDDKSKQRGGAERYYSTLSLEELKQINVEHYAADNAAIMMWVTGPQLESGIELMKSWGFTHKTVLFTWVKRTSNYWENVAKEIRKLIPPIVAGGFHTSASKRKQAFNGTHLKELAKDKWFWGMGSYTRANSEFVLLGVRGKKIETFSHAVHSVIEEPVGKHSAKPDEFYERVRKLIGEQPVLELFSRTERDNFHCLGDQMSKPHYLLDDKFRLIPVSASSVEMIESDISKPNAALSVESMP